MKTPSHCRVLCVDDDQDCADTTVAILQFAGFQAKACYDGASALEVAEEFRPDVCIIDLNMAGMQGDEVAKNMRRQAWCPRVLVSLTACSDAESRERTAAAGIQVHMVKPVAPEDLLCVVDTLCHQSALGEPS